MTGGEIIGGGDLLNFTLRLRSDLADLRVKIGNAVADEIESAVVENFQRKRPEWPDYKDKSYEKWRLAHGYTKMLVVHATLQNAITSGFDEEIGVIWCGIPAAVGDESKLEKIARAHEFGSTFIGNVFGKQVRITIPERSYLRTGFNDARPKILEICNEEAEKKVRKWS